MLKPTDLDRIHDALAALDETEPLYQAIALLFKDAMQEATEFATHPDTPEEKRSGWAGRVRGLSDCWTTFEEIRTGVYRQWPGYTKDEEPGLA